jgi:hypothetical protein
VIRVIIWIADGMNTKSALFELLIFASTKLDFLFFERVNIISFVCDLDSLMLREI